MNLPGDRRRPLVTGPARPVDLRVLALAAAGVAVAGAALLGWACAVVTVAGLAVSAAYSQPPVRLAGRGAVASLVLPAGHVAVPYLLGLFTTRPLQVGDLVLLAGLYVGFIGRILLKDFRDVHGDALFGKRTFLVRHGRRRTCRVSAACWVGGGMVLVVGAGSPRPSLVLAYALGVAAALGLLRALATDGGQRRDEALISATAIVGRGLVLLLLGHLCVPTGLASDAVTGAMAVVIAGQAWVMGRHGPMTRLTVPAAWTAQAAPVTGRSSAPGRSTRRPARPDCISVSTRARGGPRPGRRRYGPGPR